LIKATRVIMLAPPVREVKATPEQEASDELRESDLASARRAADEVLAVAREEASRLLREARDEGLAITRHAEREAEGASEKIREEAYRQGLAQAQTEIGDLFSQAQTDIDAILREANRMSEELLDDLEPRIFKLALEVAEKILGYELDHNESAFMSMLKEALGNVKNEKRVTLRVNPSEYVRFFKSSEATIHTRNGSLKADVVNDPTIDYAGCLIETESGGIDAGVGAQLAQIGKNLGIGG